MINNLCLPLHEILALGGDERLKLNHLGQNKYGTMTKPNPNEIAFASSTASNISEYAFDFLINYQKELIKSKKTEELIYKEELNKLRVDISKLLLLDDEKIIFSPSGSDIHLYLTLLFASIHQNICNISVSSNETGGSVPLALSAKHFMKNSPNGALQEIGSQIINNCKNYNVEARDINGNLKCDFDVKFEIERIIKDEIKNNSHCLLFIADVSKTGLIFPSLKIAFELKEKYGKKLDIIIDACQFRISPQTIKAYLDNDFIIALTGSKFLATPIFSGFIITPNKFTTQFSNIKLPNEINNYCNKYEWPDEWLINQQLYSETNFGLLFRLKATIFELQRYLSLLEADILTIKEKFASVFYNAINKFKNLEFVAIPQNDREILNYSPPSHENIQTIHTFIINDKNGEPLNEIDIKYVYNELKKENIKLGQPVKLYTNQCNKDIYALRLCLSTPLIYEAINGNFDKIISDITYSLNEASEIALNCLNEIENTKKSA